MYQTKYKKNKFLSYNIKVAEKHTKNIIAITLHNTSKFTLFYNYDDLELFRNMLYLKQISLQTFLPMEINSHRA